MSGLWLIRQVTLPPPARPPLPGHGLQGCPHVEVVADVGRCGWARHPAAVHEADVVDKAGQVCASGTFFAWKDSHRPSRRPRQHLRPAGPMGAVNRRKPWGGAVTWVGNGQELLVHLPICGDIHGQVGPPVHQVVDKGAGVGVVVGDLEEAEPRVNTPPELQAPGPDTQSRDHCRRQGASDQNPSF